MCDPLTIAGLVLAAGGAAANIYQSRSAAAAQQQSQQQEQQIAQWNQRRQDELRRQQDARIAQGLTQVQPAKYASDQAALADRRNAAYQPEVAGGTRQALDPSALYSAQSVADPETKSKIAGTLADATAEARNRIKAIAAMSSWGSTDEGAQRALKAMGTDVGMLTALRQGANTATMNAIKTADAYKMPTDSTMGDILSGSSQLAFGASAGAKKLGIDNTWATTPLWGAPQVAASGQGSFDANEYLRNKGV